MTDKTELIKRYIFLLVGLFVNGLGVSFITKAGLGTSPITSIPYTLSLGFTPTVGMFTLVFNIFLVILQVILLRRNFQLQNLLQLPIIALFSFFIDLTMSLLGFMQPETYAMKIVSLIVGCLILGFGVFMEMVAILSFIMFKHLDGVREGTIVAAILVGFIARLFKKYIGGIEKILIS